MTTRATLPSAARLHRPSEYASALQGKRIARGAMFVVMTPRAPASDDGMARLGLIIAKRHAVRASTRNTIKRVLREAFRARRHALPARDYVFRLHAPVPPTSLTMLRRQVRIEADALLDRIRS